MNTITSRNALTRRKLLSGVAAGSLLAATSLSLPAHSRAEAEMRSTGRGYKQSRVSMGPALSYPAPSEVALYLPSLER